jgi:hypothetical protein
MSYADDPVATIANFTAAGAFVAIILGVSAEGGFEGLESWVARGVFGGGLLGIMATLIDALT